jgi:hypothetical protein
MRRIGPWQRGHTNTSMAQVRRRRVAQAQRPRRVLYAVVELAEHEAGPSGGICVTTYTPSALRVVVLNRGLGVPRAARACG